MKSIVRQIILPDLHQLASGVLLGPPGQEKPFIGTLYAIIADHAEACNLGGLMSMRVFFIFFLIRKLTLLLGPKQDMLLRVYWLCKADMRNFLIDPIWRKQVCIGFFFFSSNFCNL